MIPLSMNITRWLTFLANPISWVTTHIVMPSCASFTMTSKTSPTISGSRAEVGSSNNITIGSIHRARAIATRCCWPPDSWPGNLSFCSSKPTRSRYLRPCCLASSIDRLSTLIWAMVKFSMTERCGNNSKCWNTMPTFARKFGKSVLGSCKRIPFTISSPSWNGSRALIVLIRVDLPDPDGPQITTTSPFLMVVEQSVRTWNWPYHFEICCNSIISIYFLNSSNDGNFLLNPANDSG